MSIIYSVDVNTHVVKVHTFVPSGSDSAHELDRVAKNFIRFEEGERRAETAFYAAETSPQEPGYFLRCNNDHIDVYKKELVESIGYLGWKSFTERCEHKLQFGVCSANDIIPANAGNITRRSAPKPVGNEDFAKELAERVQARRRKLDIDDFEIAETPLAHN